MSDRISYEERKELPDSVYGLPERREYPMPDAAHVRAAEAYFRYCPEELKPKLARAILTRAREYGVDVESPTVLDYAKFKVLGLDFGHEDRFNPKTLNYKLINF